MIRTHSPIVIIGVRAATPIAVAVAVFLFFAGHNRPGGGFAAGLVLGAVVALRSVAGLEHRVRAGTVIGTGAIIATAVALAPLLAGHTLLDQVVVEADLPLLGTVKTGSALIFDLGVTVIVVGLVMAVIEGLGADELAKEPTADPGPILEEASS